MCLDMWNPTNVMKSNKLYLSILASAALLEGSAKAADIDSDTSTGDSSPPFSPPSTSVPGSFQRLHLKSNPSPTPAKLSVTLPCMAGWDYEVVRVVAKRP